MNKLVYFLLFLNILIADSYWLLPPILGSILFTIPMFFIGMGEHSRNLKKYSFIAIPFLLFYSYLMVVQIFRGENIGVSFYIFVTNVFVILSVLYLRQRSYYLYWYLIAFLICNLAVQFIQMRGVRVTGGILLSPFGFREYAEVDLFDSTRGFRYSGLYTNLVALAFFSGIITAYFWILYTLSGKKKHLIIAGLSMLMSLLTNTRAVMYFIVPAILISDFIVKKKFSGKIIMLCLLFLGAFYILNNNTGFDRKDSSVSIKNIQEDAGVIHRVQANLYGTIGTLSLNPLWGISEEEQYKAIQEGYNICGLVYGDYFMDQVTYHNLPLYYLRVYGIVGFFLFLFCYWRLFVFAYRLTDSYDRQFMLSALIFFFIYNLSHNMKINYLIFWMAISANFEPYRTKYLKK